ncbi:hypothetical protein [[Mycoplasma] imitans]|uniref:hypothetical protein n=1 Tax=[Mycoplasma] imitans TaxID=29560 RepID=UPI00047F4399|nr:hypothetical protein [[Mycoplasma] imitans]
MKTNNPFKGKNNEASKAQETKKTKEPKQKKVKEKKVNGNINFFAKFKEFFHKKPAQQAQAVDSQPANSAKKSVFWEKLTRELNRRLVWYFIIATTFGVLAIVIGVWAISYVLGSITQRVIDISEFINDTTNFGTIFREQLKTNSYVMIAIGSILVLIGLGIFGFFAYWFIKQLNAKNAQNAKLLASNTELSNKLVETKNQLEAAKKAAQMQPRPNMVRPMGLPPGNNALMNFNNLRPGMGQQGMYNQRQGISVIRPNRLLPPNNSGVPSRSPSPTAPAIGYAPRTGQSPR